MAPYSSGPELVRFFNEFGSEDYYGDGFPTRFYYCEEKLREFNETPEMVGIIEAALDPLNYVEHEEHDASTAADYLNQYMRRDGFEVVRRGDVYRVADLGGVRVTMSTPGGSANLDHDYIAEQVQKASDRIGNDDHSGAITTARTLVEAVLTSIEAALDPDAPAYDGEMMRLYNRVRKLLHLDPSRKDISNALKQVLVGLSSIVAGLAPMRNKMGDAHATRYAPAPHHSRLAVNAAKTLSDFLLSSYEYQTEKGLVRPPEERSDGA